MNNNEFASKAGSQNDANQTHTAAAQAGEERQPGDDVAPSHGRVLLDAMLTAFPPEAAKSNEDGALVWAAIRLMFQDVFSKLPCFKAFSDKMREAGGDGLSNIWFAECSGKNADSVAPPDIGAANRAAMVALVRHYVASPHFYRQRQPASLTDDTVAVPRACAAEASFGVPEGHPSKICLIVDKDISMLVVHENEEMGCPSNRTYLYAWPGGEAFYPNGATLDGMAQPGGAISLVRPISARDFFYEVVVDTLLG